MGDSGADAQKHASDRDKHSVFLGLLTKRHFIAAGTSRALHPRHFP